MIWADLKQRLTSRKFWLSFMGAVVVILINTFGMEEASATLMTYGVVIIVVAYVLGESFVDMFKEKFGITVTRQEDKTK